MRDPYPYFNIFFPTCLVLGMKYFETSVIPSSESVTELLSNLTVSFLNKIFKNEVNWQQFCSIDLTIAEYKKLKKQQDKSSSQSERKPFINSNNNNRRRKSLMPLEMVKRLLSVCDPNLQDIDKQTPIHYICEAGNPQLLHLFLSSRGKDIDINASDINQQTYLHLGAINRHYEVIELLLKHGAKIDVLDVDQRSPLFYTIIGNDFQSMTLLLGSGQSVDFNQRDRFGKLAIDYAIQNDNQNIVKHLIEKGAQHEEHIKNTHNK